MRNLILNILYIIINVVLIFGLVVPFLLTYDNQFLRTMGVLIIVADAYHISHLIFNLIIKNNK